MLNITMNNSSHEPRANLFPENIEQEFLQQELLQLQRENVTLRKVNKGLQNRLELLLRRAIALRMTRKEAT